MGFIPRSESQLESKIGHLCWLTDHALLIGWDQDGCSDLAAVSLLDV